eukprot:COSAG04_NODE_19940_length_404_cov_2.406557_1_plen_88_part_01
MTSAGRPWAPPSGRGRARGLFGSGAGAARPRRATSLGGGTGEMGEEKMNLLFITTERCYTTAPLCVPMRASMMSGMYASTTGIMANNH